jgi:hypothetical protein
MGYCALLTLSLGSFLSSLESIPSHEQYLKAVPQGDAVVLTYWPFCGEGGRRVTRENALFKELGPFSVSRNVRVFSSGS